MPSRHWSEELARSYLEGKGWTLLAANYVLRFAEIDLVMRDGPTVVFVEVRQRSYDGFGGAAGSIGGRKVARLRRAAEQFALSRYGSTEVPMRLDAVLVRGHRMSYEITHLEAIG